MYIFPDINIPDLSDKCVLQDSQEGETSCPEERAEEERASKTSGRLSGRLNIMS